MQTMHKVSEILPVCCIRPGQTATSIRSLQGMPAPCGACGQSLTQIWTPNPKAKNQTPICEKCKGKTSLEGSEIRPATGSDAEVDMNPVRPICSYRNPVLAATSFESRHDRYMHVEFILSAVAASSQAPDSKQQHHACIHQCISINLEYMYSN